MRPQPMRKEVLLDVHKLALPAQKICPVNLIKLLPEDLSVRYASFNEKLVNQAKRRSRPAVVRALPGHYVRIVRKCIELGLMRVQRKKPQAINGLFGVEKDEVRQRLIFHGDNANESFVEAEAVKLPNPSTFANLVKDKRKQLQFLSSTTSTRVAAAIHGIASSIYRRRVGLPCLCGIAHGMEAFGVSCTSGIGIFGKTGGFSTQFGVYFYSGGLDTGLHRRFDRLRLWKG
eukprot:Awhi_evm2s13101